MDFKVIKSGTNRKLVYDFLLVVCSNFCSITHRSEKFDVKQSNDLGLTASCESCRVAIYVKCSEYSERKKQKSPFSTTTRSFDAMTPPPQGTLRDICINLILPETMFLGLHFLSLTVYGWLCKFSNSFVRKL